LSWATAALHQSPTVVEQAAFTTALRPQVESGRGQDRTAIAFLTAVKG
jgi:hypothetical protein